MDAAASTFSKRTPLAYLMSIHTARTPSPVHLLHSYTSVPASKIFTYITIDPECPLHDSSEEIVIPKGNPTPPDNQPNPVPNE